MIKKSVSLFLVLVVSLTGFILFTPSIYAYDVEPVEDIVYEYVYEGSKEFLTSFDEYNNQIQVLNDGLLNDTNIEPYSWWEYAYDQYEYNDTFHTATFIDSYWAKSFNITIYGTLHRYPFWYVGEWFTNMNDEDYYRFILTADAELTVNLSEIPGGCDYELELYKLKSESISKNHPMDLGEMYSKVGGSYKTSNQSEKITYQAQAGEYVIKIYTHSGTNDDDFYRLNITSNPNPYHSIQSKSINDFKNEGSKFIVWKSDYYPMSKSLENLESNTYIGDLTLVSTSGGNYTQSNYYYTMYPKLDEVDETRLLDSAIYVWDPDVKTELRELYIAIYNELNSSEVRQYDELAIGLKILAGPTLGTVSIVVSFIPGGKVVGVVLSVVSIAASEILNYTMPSEHVVGVDESMAYYAAYISALETGPNGYENEVVCIRNYIGFKNVQKSSEDVAEKHFDVVPRWYATANYVDENSLIDWRGPKNEFTQEHDQLFGGQIYGIENEEQLNFILTSDKSFPGRLIVPSAHNHDYHYEGSFHDHYEKCSCGEFGQKCQLTPQVQLYNTKTHTLSCHGFNSVEPHEKYLTGNVYRCSTNGCNWIQTVQFDYINTEDYEYEPQYFFDERVKDIVTQSGANIFTKRLRTGIIDNKLVMSAKRSNAGTAYIEYHFDYNITRVDYQLALWSSNESLILNSSIRIEAMDTDGIWIPLREFDARTMSQDKDILINYFSEIDFLSKAFRFIVETNQVQNDNNRGRVVIGDIRVIRNHTHTYHSPYIPAGDAGHLSTCSCGATTLQLHIAGPHEHGDRYVNCMRCNYLIDLWNSGPIIVIPNNNHDEYYHKSFRGIYDMIDVCCSKIKAITQIEEEFYENYKLPLL